MTGESVNKQARRQAELRAKRAAKEQKRRDRADAALICPPDAANRSLKMRLLGYICRVPVMLCAVAGLGTLLNSAFRLGEDGAAFLPSLIAVALLSLLCYGRWYTTLGGTAIGVGLLVAHWMPHGVSHIYGVLDVGINGILQRLYDAGYYGYKQYQSQLTPYELEHHAELMQDFVALLCLIIALLFVPFLARRIRLIVPLITSVGLIVPIFTFNLPVSNWAVTGIIAGSCALLIMWGYQRRYDAKSEKESDSELFSDLRRPTLPEQMQARATQKEEEKARRQAHRDRVRERRATGLVTVEEEINDYLAAPTNKKQPRAQSRLDADAAAQKARRKQERAQYRAVLHYDRVTRETRCAMGGVVGVCVMVLILVIMLLPTVAVDAPFGTINSIEHRVQYYREYVTAALRGNDAVLEMYTYGEQIRNEKPHSTTAETQEFEDITLMRLYTQFGAPVYLQGWVGVNYADGAWSSANDDQLYQWRELYDAADMPAETMFEDFYQLMRATEKFEVESLDDLKRRYYGFDEYGFVMYMINIKRLYQLGSELYLPRVSSETLGLYDYGTTTPVNDPWAIYFDGVAVSSIIDQARKDISIEAYVPLQEDPDWYLNVSKLIAAYNASVKEILRYEDTRNKNNFRPNYQYTYIDTRELGRYSPAQQYIEMLGSSERADALSGMKDAQVYTDFVYETYLGASGSDIIADLAQKLYTETYHDDCYVTEINEETGLLERVELLPGAQPMSFALSAMRDSTMADTYAQRHMLTMAVINYLVENHEYSLEITTQGQDDLDGVENFLTVTKQGYCVQFASSAALILRELGIPVRYMEGYVCTDYTRRIGASQDEARFIGEVMDNDKHAWIEVWFDGIGWVVYETTPAYYVDMYGSSSTTAGILTPQQNGNRPVTPPEQPPTPILPPVVEPEIDPDTGVVPPAGIDYAWLIKSILLTLAIVAVVVLVIVLIVWFIRRGRRAQMERSRFAEMIIAGDSAIFDTEEHRSAAAKLLIRNTLHLLALYGSAPGLGELRDDYAKRLSFSYEDVFGYPIEYDDGALGQREHISRVNIGSLMEAIAAEEFGYGMAKADMARLARFYLALHDFRHTRISAPRRWALRYVKREI